MKSVTVIGCGIIGLTTAIKIQERGHKVTIVAKEKFQNTLSSKVGAIWFPFEVYPKEKANQWSAVTYETYRSDVKPGNGVSFIHFLSVYNQESNNDWIDQLPEGTVRKAREEELPLGIEMAYVSLVPLAEPLLYLPYLYDRFIENGGVFKKETLQSLKVAADLDDIVVNCTGLGAKELCNDQDLKPMRGQILRCKKMDLPSFANSTVKGALTYIINRENDCVIGGTDYEDDWNREIDKADTDLMMERINRAKKSNEPPEILEEIVGLRPKRSAVRLEYDDEFPHVIHNYGHGGAGFTVAWGCAVEVVEKVESMRL